MSTKYDEYLAEHRANVVKAFNWIKTNLSDTIDKDVLEKAEYNCVYMHDQSKNSLEEYVAYDEYFYSGNRSFEVTQNFRYAWLHHIHNNPHHWQYWILNNDEAEEGELILDMPNEYIIEMVCDWWSFSWKVEDLNELFRWYEEHEDYIKLSRGTRTKVENMLKIIKYKLSEVEENNETRNN